MRSPSLGAKLAYQRSLGHIRIHTNLAAAHLDHGELDAAREQLGRALEIDPSYREALGNLAIVELEDGNVAGAISHYRRILEFKPSDFLTWNNLGIAELRRKRYSAASSTSSGRSKSIPTSRWHEAIWTRPTRYERARVHLGL